MERIVRERVAGLEERLMNQQEGILAQGRESELKHRQASDRAIQDMESRITRAVTEPNQRIQELERRARLAESRNAELTATVTNMQSREYTEITLEVKAELTKTSKQLQQVPLQKPCFDVIHKRTKFSSIFEHQVTQRAEGAEKQVKELKKKTRGKTKRK